MLDSSSMEVTSLRHSLASLAGPSDEIIEKGGMLTSRIHETVDYAGSILDESGDVVWRSETRPTRSPYSPANLLKKPAFVIVEPDGSEIAQVSRCRRLPPTFSIRNANGCVGTIRLRSVLRNLYSVSLGSENWLFRMPLFHVDFGGVSDLGGRVWVRMGPSKKQWNILFALGVKHREMAVAIAFIHREWWCYS